MSTTTAPADNLAPAIGAEVAIVLSTDRVARVDGPLGRRRSTLLAAGTILAGEVVTNVMAASGTFRLLSVNLEAEEEVTTPVMPHEVIRPVAIITTASGRVIDVPRMALVGPADGPTALTVEPTKILAARWMDETGEFYIVELTFPAGTTEAVAEHNRKIIGARLAEVACEFHVVIASS